MRSPLHRSLVLGTLSLSLSLASGCRQPAPNTPVQVTGTPAPQAPAQAAIAGITGSADLNGVAFANADVKVYRPGQSTPFAVGKTGPDGHFTLTLGSVIAPGGANVVSPGGGNVIAPGGGNVVSPGGGNVIAPGGGNVIAPGGGNVIAPGGGNVIAPGGGNVIAPGGGNVIAPGGANLLAMGAPLKVVASKDGASLAAIATAGVIAAGGGNVIAPGGGNVIAAGGMNYQVAAVNRNDVHLTPATTLAVISLGKRLEGALDATDTDDGQLLESTLDKILDAYDRVSNAIGDSLAGQSGEAIAQAIAQAADSGQLPPALQDALNTDNDFKSVFIEVAKDLGDALHEAAATGGDTPDSESKDELIFGTVEAPPVDPNLTGSDTTTDPTTSLGDGVPAPTPTPAIPRTIAVGGTLGAASSATGNTTLTVPAVKSYSGWQQVGLTYDPTTARAGFATVSVPVSSSSEDVYLIGGSTDGSTPMVTNQVVRETFAKNAADGTFYPNPGTATGSLTMARFGHAAAVLGNYAYVTGGRVGSPAAATGSLESIPTANLSTVGSSFTDVSTRAVTPRYGHAMAVAGPAATAVMYVVGGRDDSGVLTSNTVGYTTQFDVPTGALNPWTYLPATNGLRHPRWGHATIVTKNGSGWAYLYVIGGRDAAGPVADVERLALNPTTGAPVAGASFTLDSVKLEDPATHVSRARWGLGAVVQNGQVFVFGGLTVSGTATQPSWGSDVASVLADGTLSTFSPFQSDFVSGRGEYGFGQLSTDGSVFAIGGWPGNPGSMPAPRIERAIWR